MKLVSNASTLILLAKATALQSWLEQVDGVIIPTEVYDETVLGKDTYDARLIKKIIDEHKILIEKSPKKKVESIMKEFRLDMGEAAAYAVFDPKHHEAIMTDDAELIKLCKVEGLAFVGAMAIVVALYQEKKILKEEALEKLKRLYEIGRYRQEIYAYFRERIEGGN